MKSLQIALLTLAAFALVGCAPRNPPSKYGNSTPNGAGFGEGLTGGTEGPSGLPARPSNSGGAEGLFNPATGEFDPRAIMATVYFGFDRYGVSSVEGSKLSAIAYQAQNTKLIVAGYTDHFGTDQYNLGLSDKRAQSVKTYLVNLGVPESSIEIKAFGKQYARLNGSKDEVREDRRAVVVDASFQP